MVVNCFILMKPMPVNVGAIDHYISLNHQCHHHVHIRSHKIQLLKPFLHRKVILCSLIKLEFHVGKTSSEYIDNGVSDNLDVEMIGIPKKLKKNWELLIKKYH